MKVIAGKDKGKSGVVIKVLRDSRRVIVEGVRVVKKHVKGEGGGIVDLTHPVDVSNVALLDPGSGKPVRVGYEMKGGKKMRVTRPGGKALD